MAGDINDNFDSNQIIKRVYEEPHVSDAADPKLLRVRNLGGALVPDIYDEYFVTMADIDQISSIAFFKDSSLIATVNCEYYPNGTFKRAYRM